MDDKVNAPIEEFVADGEEPADWLESWHSPWNVKPTKPIPILFESAKGEGKMR